jgi:hypothetical protein
MTYELQFAPKDEPGVDVVLRTAGPADLAVFEQYLRELVGDARWRPGMKVLVDFTDLDARRLTAADVRQLADLHARFQAELDAPAVAIVAGTSLNFGLVRMWQSLVEGRVEARTRAFYTLAEARAWLAGVATLHRSAPEGDE